MSLAKILLWLGKDSLQYVRTASRSTPHIRLAQVNIGFRLLYSKLKAIIPTSWTLFNASWTHFEVSWRLLKVAVFGIFSVQFY